MTGNAHNSDAATKREDNYQALVLLLLNQGRTAEAARLMERHEARREWEAKQSV